MSSLQLPHTHAHSFFRSVGMRGERVASGGKARHWVNILLKLVWNLSRPLDTPEAFVFAMG
jgi:hypothetical protein